MGALPASPHGVPSPLWPPLRLANARIECEVSHTLIGLEHLRREWDALVEAVRGPIEMTYDWCRVWWAHYAGPSEVRVYLFREHEALVGVAPMLIETLRLGPARLRVARIMGAVGTPAVCDVPARREWAEATIDALIDRLIGEEGCDAILLGPISDAGGRLDAIRSAALQRPDLVTVKRDRLVSLHTTIALPHTYDVYMRTLSREQRCEIRRGWRRLSDDFDVSIESVCDPQVVPAEFEAFDLMHTAQARARGRLGHFNDWPGARAYHQALASVMSRLRRVRLLRLRADGRIVARQYAYVFGSTYSCRLSARAPEPRWDDYSLGLQSLVRLFERAIDEGVSTIDAGPGAEGYKLQLGGRRHEARSILLVANRSRSRRRARVACAMADTIDHLYYRLWFRRLAPQLNVQRPRWSAWLRSRL